MIRTIIILLLSLSSSSLFAANKAVNVYAWAGEIPRSVIQKFEKEYGIKVNFSTYDSNETMYGKLRATRKNVYDVILPSGYFVERMKRKNMLMKLDHSRLDNIKNLDAKFKKTQFDINNQFSIPLIWGATGIFYNQKYIQSPPSKWSLLWQKNWKKQLLLLDDPQEIFDMTFLSLGIKPHPNKKKDIAKAYTKLLQLIPNIKLFASDNVQSIIIDEDAIIGTAWNGDVFKARQENKNINFIFPKEGFVLWVDCLAIPKNPPHLKEAYQFINYLLRADIAKEIALKEGHAITNAQGKKLLPDRIQNDPIVYPNEVVLKRAYFQRSSSDTMTTLYAFYWQKFKLSF